MRKALIVLGCMSLGLAHAQQGRTHTQHTNAQKRVGINTPKPVATLEVSKLTDVPATQVQGFLLSHLSQTERNEMTKEALVNGLMIFNTTKNCIEWWDGAHWQCTDGRFQDEHGDDFNPVKSFTGNYTHPITTQSFTRNNCVAPQVGTTVSFTSQAITKTYVSNISQEDANEQARQQALAEFNQLGQTFANTNGQCISTFSVSPAGFEGYFYEGIEFSDEPVHSVKFTVRNVSGQILDNVDLSKAVKIINSGNVEVIPNQNTNVSIPINSDATLIYQLRGQGKKGDLVAEFYDGTAKIASQTQEIKQNTSTRCGCGHSNFFGPTFSDADGSLSKCLDYAKNNPNMDVYFGNIKLNKDTKALERCYY